MRCIHRELYTLKKEKESLRPLLCDYIQAVGNCKNQPLRVFARQYYIAILTPIALHNNKWCSIFIFI